MTDGNGHDEPPDPEGSKISLRERRVSLVARALPLANSVDPRDQERAAALLQATSSSLATLVFFDRRIGRLERTADALQHGLNALLRNAGLPEGPEPEPYPVDPSAATQPRTPRVDGREPSGLFDPTAE